MPKLEILTGQFKKAIARLKEVLAAPENDIVRDSAIQRFEFTFDLSWKTIKEYLREERGIICNSPKECFREAYHQGIIKYDKDWIEFVEMRNETVHTYNEENAKKIYDQLPEALKHFEVLLEVIEKGVKEIK